VRQFGDDNSPENFLPLSSLENVIFVPYYFVMHTGTRVYAVGKPKYKIKSQY